MAPLIQFTGSGLRQSSNAICGNNKNRKGGISGMKQPSRGLHVQIAKCLQQRKMDVRRAERLAGKNISDIANSGK